MMQAITLKDIWKLYEESMVFEFCYYCNSLDWWRFIVRLKLGPPEYLSTLYKLYDSKLEFIDERHIKQI